MAKVFRVGSFGAVLALACSGAFALEANLGTLSSTAVTFGNTFYDATNSFTDYYTFNIASSGTVSGTTSDGSLMAAKLTLTKDVVLTSLMLTNTARSVVYGMDLSIPTDGSTNTFSFAGLSAGTYSLAVQGYVKAGLFSASYTGSMSTTATAPSALNTGSASVASPAPEAADLALTVMGLAGVALLLRRGRKAA